ncbi:MAG: type II toxin-antitoxin system RelB/DinJ family antitoxin [Peptococcaceae bacterium]|jgi:DNA-damage-inducible protein J|nr:type II toxin-antitoxin system RelB/DinJ family antitoxin [Peptococcaceae bacterium]
MVTIQVRIDNNTKTAVDTLFTSLGLDTSTAVRMFFTASLECDGLPFAVRRHELAPSEKTGSRSAMFGCLRGKYKMSDDFDAPLDDFKEYMR